MGYVLNVPSVLVRLAVCWLAFYLKSEQIDDQFCLWQKKSMRFITYKQETYAETKC
jgi:hypothetical protein